MPRCGDRTAHHLSQVLETQPELLPELLGLMAAAGQRVPELLLPKLLRHGQRNTAIRPALKAVLGERGRWLAAQNPDWRYGQGQAIADFATETPALKALWPGEDAQSRAINLRAWRQVDAQAAREALAAAWSSELAQERQALLGALATHLSLADEAFLESALGDRGKAVRKVAADLLAQLSGSGFGDRMARRASAWVQMSQAGSGLAIAVTLPEAYDEDWKRDGIELKAPRGEGQRAWWLRQILAYTPLAVWQAEPSAIVPALAGHEWQDSLLLGWGLAAQRQGNAAWAEALLGQFGLRQFKDLQFVELLALLSADTQERFWRDFLISRMPKGKQPEEKALAFGLEQLSQTELSLSIEFSRLLIQRLKLHCQSQQQHPYQWTYSARGLARRLHPETAAEFAELLDTLPEGLKNPYGQNSLQTMLSCLRFRREMHQVFDASG